MDGRHEILTNWFPVVDTISIEEALKNKWLSDFKHYLVVLDVDIEPYVDANRDFYRGFEFFNRKFDVAMRCRTDYKYRMAYAKQLTTRSSEIPDANKLVMANAMLFGKGLQARKNFIANHPKKIELANKILEYRQDRKCIVFCHTIKLADKVNALVYSGKDSGKKGRVKLDDFIQAQTGAIATSKKLIAGFDCPDLSVMIDLDVNSSKIRSSQSIGRTLRYIPGKETEIFTLVLRGTVEWDWFVKSHSVDSYITIDEFNLMNILEGKEYAIKKNKEIHKMYWY